MICRKCSQPIEPRARYCLSCGSFDITSKRSKRIIVGVSLTATLISLQVVLFLLLPKILTALEPPEIELISMHVERPSDNYFSVTGEVRNVTDRKMESVWAHISVHNTAGELIVTERWSVDHSPLMPGQTSPFRVMVRYSSQKSVFTIMFADYYGKQFKTTDPVNEVWYPY